MKRKGDNMVNENLMPLSRAAKHIPGRAGRGVSRTTAWRLAVEGRDGVLLETVEGSGGMLTSIPAIRRFMQRLTEVRRNKRGDNP